VLLTRGANTLPAKMLKWFRSETGGIEQIAQSRFWNLRRTQFFCTDHVAI